MMNIALIADANDLTRSFVSHVLKSVQFDVIETRSEEEAWNIFLSRRDEISYVFTDIRLAQGSGTSLYRRIRDSSESKVVVLSGANPGVDTGGIENDSFGMTLLQPFTVEELIQSTLLIEDPYRLAQAQ